MPRYASTNTPLGANETVTLNLQSGREDFVVGLVASDQAGTIFIEQSMDGTNYDESTTYAVAANDGKAFKEDVIAPYIRVRYVNGGVTQGTFRLNARLSSSGNR